MAKRFNLIQLGLVFIGVLGLVLISFIGGFQLAQKPDSIQPNLSAKTDNIPNFPDSAPSLMPVVSTVLPSSLPSTNQPKLTQVGQPKILKIPKIGVDAQVEWVSKSNTGSMAPPEKSQEAAWYQLGPKPGQVGNAVIAGHLDSSNPFKPKAVFNNLKSLQPNDFVYIHDDLGQLLRFRVVARETFNRQDIPLSAIFGFNDKPRLNLVTCDGGWNFFARSYNQRLVVFTELDSPSP